MSGPGAQSFRPPLVVGMLLREAYHSRLRTLRLVSIKPDYDGGCVRIWYKARKPDGTDVTVTRDELADFDPDFDDAQTRACLLGLVRQAYGDPTITTQYHPSEGDPERKRWRVWHNGCPIAYGGTEAEALVTALERSAAPPVAPVPVGPTKA